MTDFAWLIEAPGQNYLEAREIGHYPEFVWTTDHTRALRFYSKDQADKVMMAVRRLDPKLWAFAVNLGEAWPVEHGWLPDGALAPLAPVDETQRLTPENDRTSKPCADANARSSTAAHSQRVGF
jgi:hypothetical protein